MVFFFIVNFVLRIDAQDPKRSGLLSHWPADLGNEGVMIFMNIGQGLVEKGRERVYFLKIL